MPPHRYFVDEAGDGVLFGARGGIRLDDPKATRFFMLGMITVADEAAVLGSLTNLRRRLRSNPLYASIRFFHPAEQKTALFFHAKDDHPEIRAQVFESLVNLDFRFSAVIKDMRHVLEYVRQLFHQRLHVSEHIEVVFARRGHTDRTSALQRHLLDVASHSPQSAAKKCRIDVRPMHSHENACLQVADYCLWALQRCYERCETRFMEALWPKVSLIRDLDDSRVNQYGTYLTRKSPPPTESAIKNRRI